VIRYASGSRQNQTQALIAEMTDAEISASPVSSAKVGNNQDLHAEIEKPEFRLSNQNKDLGHSPQRNW
jgi:hypothetical protein